MTKRVYAYTVIGKDDEPWQRTVGQTVITGTGLIKVGQTTKGSAKTRIKQQLGTAYPDLKGVTILLDDPATKDDGSEFTDHEVHTALVAHGIKRQGGEWFEATLDEVKSAINMVRSGKSFDPTRTESFDMRPEQQAAVKKTAKYFTEHADEKRPLKFLWNAKMRFGKTFTAYQLARQLGWSKVLVLTYKPAVQTAWKDDLLGHVDFEGWKFLDRNSDPVERDYAADSQDPSVWFASFQDLTGKTDDGQVKDHNEVIHLVEWDAIILDEYHFGAWRDGARDLYDPTDAKAAEEEEPDEQIDQDDLGLTANHILYLSGTPFRAITNGEFSETAIYNWTYVDEQAEKAEWDEADGPNPYAALPQMLMFTYEMGKSATDYAEDGEFNGFSLTEFFKAERLAPGFEFGSFGFLRENDVSEFLEMLRGKLSEQMKMLVVAGQKAPFPYEHVGFKQAIRHSVWYLPDVGSCHAMSDLLATHPFFSGFEIVIAAGTKAGLGAAALPPVEQAIGVADKEHKPGSITLTCGKLMTGVTVREWGAILMLRSLKSPETYFQSAFRVQSPWAVREPGGELEVLKDVCYVFEFDPNRALSLVAEYGVKLATSGDVTPSQAIGELINYLPIFTFSGGEMIPVDATAVLDWASAGIGAAALARRWNSPLLVNVNEHTISAVFDHPALLEALERVEDFRALVQDGQAVVTSTKLLKKAKRDQGGKLDKEQKKEQSETAKKRAEIREKLQKFLAKIPVFMYVTDFREEALKHVIESLDSALFERVTGLTVDDFKLLSDLGLFNKQNLDAAIYQFRSFERASLSYAEQGGHERYPESPIGLFDSSVQFSEEPGHLTPVSEG